MSSPAHQAVTDLCAALGIDVPEFATRVTIDASADSLVRVDIEQIVLDDVDLTRIRKHYRVGARRTLSIEEDA